MPTLFRDQLRRDPTPPTVTRQRYPFQHVVSLKPYLHSSSWRYKSAERTGLHCWTKPRKCIASVLLAYSWDSSRAASRFAYVLSGGESKGIKHGRKPSDISEKKQPWRLVFLKMAHPVLLQHWKKYLLFPKQALFSLVVICIFPTSKWCYYCCWKMMLLSYYRGKWAILSSDVSIPPCRSKFSFKTQIMWALLFFFRP